MPMMPITMPSTSPSLLASFGEGFVLPVSIKPMLARVHHQYLPDVLGFEPGALTLQQQQRLQKKGHTLEELTRNYGNQQVLLWQKKTGHSDAASDPRGQGVSLSH